MRNQELEKLIRSGRVDEALQRAHAGLAVANTSGDPAAHAVALVDEARAEWAHGDRDAAVTSVDEAIWRARRTFGPSDPRTATCVSASP